MVSVRTEQQSQQKPYDLASNPLIQVFKLRRQNRSRQPLSSDVAAVRERTLGTGVQKIGVVLRRNVKKRQASATLPTTSEARPTGPPSTGSSPSTASTIITTTVFSTVTNPAGGGSTVTVFETVTSLPGNGATPRTAQPAPLIVTATQTEVIVPSLTIITITSGTAFATISVPPGVVFPKQSQPPLSGSAMGSDPSVGASITDTQPNFASVPASPSFSGINVPPLSSHPSMPTIPTTVDSTSSSTTRGQTSTIAGSVVGGFVALLIFTLLCYRLRRRRRLPDPVLLVDPFRDEVEAPVSEQPRHTSAATAAAAAVDAEFASPSHSQLLFSPARRKSGKQEVHGHASISASNSPPSTSAQDSIVTMADLNTLRARLLEVENLALRQHVMDAENMTRPGPSNFAGSLNTTRLGVIRSESPPEYASPLVEIPSESHAYSHTDLA